MDEQQDGAVSAEDVAYSWWKGLLKDRGARAELRRAADLSAVVMVPAYHRLYRKLTGTKWRSRESVALVAGALAHLSQDDNRDSFPEQMGRKRESGSKSVVSGLRFRRLIQLKDLNDFFVRLIRILKLLDGRANVRDLARDLYWWRFDNVQRDWAFKYYSKAPAED